jgi:spore germination protein YaaH
VEGHHALLVPKGSAADFHTRYELALEDWVANRNEQIYFVKEGDNLSSIAARFNVPLPALLIWNNLNPNRPIHPGDRLVVYPPQEVREGIDNN